MSVYDEAFYKLDKLLMMKENLILQQQRGEKIHEENMWLLNSSTIDIQKKVSEEFGINIAPKKLHDVDDDKLIIKELYDSEESHGI